MTHRPIAKIKAEYAAATVPALKAELCAELILALKCLEEAVHPNWLSAGAKGAQ